MTAWEQGDSETFTQTQPCPWLGGVATPSINVLSCSVGLFRLITIMVGFVGVFNLTILKLFQYHIELTVLS